jgi:DNA primase
MLNEFITNKLKAKNLKFTPSGNNYIMTSCLNPAHNDKNPSFAINLETGVGHCFSCKFHVDIDYWTNGKLSEELVEDLKRQALYGELIDKLRVEEQVADTEVFLPPMSAMFEEDWRRLDKDHLNDIGVYKIQKGRYKNRDIFPMFNKDKMVTAFNTRTLGDDTPKYLYSKGIKVDELVYPPVTIKKGYVVLVEGIMDALSLVQDGIPAIYNFGVGDTLGPKKIAQLLRAGVDTIYILFDKDKAGMKGTLSYISNENLKDFFTIKLGHELPELEEFIASKCKDYNEFITSR